MTVSPLTLMLQRLSRGIVRLRWRLIGVHWVQDAPEVIAAPELLERYYGCESSYDGTDADD